MFDRSAIFDEPILTVFIGCLRWAA